MPRTRRCISKALHISPILISAHRERTLTETASANQTTVLLQAPLLRRLPKDDLLALAEGASLESHAARTTIFHQGDEGDALFVIVSGAVRILYDAPSGEQKTLAVLRAADCFGELAVLDGQPRSAAAIATEDTVLLRVGRDDIRAWLAARPQASLALLETLSLRLRQTNEALVEIAFSNIERRIARLLLRLSAELPTSRDIADPATIKITQNELAALLSVTRESVNKHLKLLAQRGWLEVGRGVVTIRDFAGAGAVRPVVGQSPLAERTVAIARQSGCAALRLKGQTGMAKIV